MGKMSELFKSLASRKRVLLFSAIGLLVLLLVLLFVFRPFSSGKKYDPLSVIPDDAALIFKINNTVLLLGKDTAQKLPSQLFEFTAINEFLLGIQKLDSVFSSVEGNENVLANNTLYISLHFSSRAPATALFILETDGTAGNLEEEILAKEDMSFTEEEFEGKEYYSIDNSSFYAYRKGNLIVASQDNLLIHSSISTSDKGNSFSESENFQKCLEAGSESADINAYVHLPFLYRMLGGLFSGETYGNLSFIQDFGGWGNIDISYMPSQILLSGIFPNDNGQKSFINIFKGKSKNNTQLTTFLPLNTSAAQAFAFQDFPSFFQSWEEYMNLKEMPFDASEEQYLFNEESGSEDLADMMMSHFGGILSLFACPGTQGLEPDVFCAVSINDADELVKSLGLQMKNSSKKSQWDSLSYRGIPVFSLPVQYGAYSLFGPFFNGISKTHIAVCDSVLYIGNSVSSLKNMMNNVLSGRTLASATHYQSLQSGLNSDWNTYSYLNLNNALYLLNSNWLEDSTTMSSVQSLQEKEHGMYMAITTSKEDQGILFSGSIVFGQAEGDDVFGWFTSLDSRIESGPVLLKAPALKKYWIIASDVYENVYLLNEQGRVEWKMSIEGRPNSDYALIYGNSEEKCAVVFSAADYLYMIGIDGKSRSPFPIKIDKGIASQILVIDYDKNQKYRIIFSDKDGTIRNFNAEGKNTSGWENPKGDLQYEKNIIYRRLSGKDYIIVLQSDNTAQILTRRGESLVKIENVWFNKSCQTFFPDEEHNQFIATDKEGSIIQISPEGEKEIMIPGSYSEDYVFVILGNDYIILDEGMMYVMNINGEVITRKEVSKSSMFAIRSYFVQGQYFIGYKNHDEDMGLIGAGNNTFINDDAYDFSNFDLIEEDKKILLIKGYDKTISAEVLNMGEEVL